MARRNLTLLLGLIVNIAFAGLLFGQRGDRGIITGLISDPAGAAVPDATVTVTDEATGVKTVVYTTADGSYETTPLVLSTYTVEVEKQGFKTFVRKGIMLTSGVRFRQDASLELGMVTQTVEVTAASEMINVQTSEISHGVNQRYYQDLPLVMGTDMRLAEAMLFAQPGYVPYEPNGDPMFRGSGFNSRINGGQTMSVENWFDGAAFGYVNGHNETHESSPPVEAINEMRVATGSFSAQYGHTSGGFIEYTTKSGTSSFHGSVYEYHANRALNARGFFVPEKAPFINNSYGVTAGGPVVIPGVYDGRGKTFFFSNLDLTNLRTGFVGGYVESVPIQAFRGGDFSALLDTTNVVGTDALGRDMYEGAIYDPSSTRTVTAGAVDPVTGLTATASGYVRDPYPGNIIDLATDPLASDVAAAVVPRIPDPQIAGFSYNHLGVSTGDPNGKLDPKTFLLRIDHSVSPSFKMYTTWFHNSRPAIRNCNGPQACDATNLDPKDFAQNTDYIGPGFYQRISNRLAHQQFDWIIRPNLFNHTTISYDRWYMGGIPMSDGVGWIQELGLRDSDGNYIPTYGPGGLDGGFPTLNFAGIRPYSSHGNGWIRGFETTNRWQVLDDVTLITGKHTFKAGFEYRHHQTPQKGWNRAVTGTWNFNRSETGGFDATGANLSDTGDSFASFLLGQVNSANFVIFQPTTWNEQYSAFYLNDEFKVTSKLTLTIGLRYDYQWPKTESHDRFSSVDLTAPNPGASGIPGAMAFAGTGTGRTGSRTFEDPRTDNWGPRFGFAYRVTDRDVIRGGYGMYFSGISLNYSAPGGYPDTGMAATYPSAFGTATSPAFWWDYSATCPAGMPGCGFPAAAIIPPPLLDPTISNGLEPRGVMPDDTDLPRYQNWSLTYQRQIGDNTQFEISYIGNRGTHLPMQDFAYPDRNTGNPANLALGTAALQADINSATAQALAEVQSLSYVDPVTGNHLPFEGFSGDVAHALRPFPQYQSIIWRGGYPAGSSYYHSLQTKLERRFSNGLQFRIAHIWSQLKGNGAENGLIWWQPTHQNPIDQGADKGLSGDDVPHTLIVAYTYALPFGKGRRFGANVGGVVNQIIGGWHVAAIQRYNSGRPATVTMDNATLGSLIFNNTHRPNRGSGGTWGGGSFDPATDNYYTHGGWSDPGATTFGNAPMRDPDARHFPVYNEDINLFKEFLIKGEDVKLRFEAQFGNALNRTFFANPVENWSAADFGATYGQNNQPRHVQFGMKLTW